MGGAGGLGAALYLMRKERQRIDAAFERNRRRIARKARRRARDAESLAARLDEFRADLGRTLLMAFAANRLLADKGAVTTEEVARTARRIDLRDGRADGKLDPAMVRPADAPAAAEAPSPEEFLRRLEQEDDR
jgi:hypothetical protein